MTRCPVCDSVLADDAAWLWHEGHVPSARLFVGVPPGWRLAVWRADGAERPWTWHLTGPPPCPTTAVGYCDHREDAQDAGRAALAFFASPAAAAAPPRRAEVAPAPVPADTDHAAAGDPPSPDSRPIDWRWLGGPRWHAVRGDESVTFCGRPVDLHELSAQLMHPDPLPYMGARGCIDCLGALARAGGVG